MKEKSNNLQKEQGSVQRQIQKNESYKDFVVNSKEQNSDKQFGIVPVSQIRKPHQNKSGTGLPDLKEIGNEEIIPAIKNKRHPWNSIDFETDDLGGWVPV